MEATPISDELRYSIITLLRKNVSPSDPILQIYEGNCPGDIEYRTREGPVVETVLADNWRIYFVNKCHRSTRWSYLFDFLDRLSSQQSQ